ncbi:ABC transporter permease [Saccharothrix violaceirubra]|uniref:Putative ABC transport system permease protein n=1 Tax=Saccharothrix violaceirubra TaxID=413306 RepID=A0A7W7T3A7_9PSEU|nr:ABC transporter permease [Saccharothrix violaceirubra]MBB4965783.1 putative ABC transport system permease protein [Saccharothrix violaceirubra]
MLSIARDTLKARWTSLVATFIGLAVGVAVLSSMAVVFASALAPQSPAPSRYAEAAVVVRSPETRTVDDGAVLDNAEPEPLTKEVLAAVPGVHDRSFYAQVADRPAAAPYGRPWSAAKFAGYRLESGKAPALADEVVVAASTGAKAGDRVTVLTASGPRPYAVSGVTADVDFETAVFFTDTEAARLSPDVIAVVADGSAEQVRQAVGDRADVLTGDARVKAEPGSSRNRGALLGIVSMTATSIGVAVSVVAFVVAATFAFSITQRTREFGLLRAVGATARQVRRMVFAEALLVSVSASLLGCGLGFAGAPALASALKSAKVGPKWYELTVWVVPMLSAFVLGVGVALLAVWSAARKAGGTSPVEVLREATADTKAIGRGRLVVGLSTVVFGALVVLFVVAKASWLSMVPVLYTPIAAVPLIGVALLTPVVVKPLARLLTWPLGRSKGATGMLVRASIVTAVRRTATTAGPVLLLVGLSVTMLGVTYTVGSAEVNAERATVTADHVVTPAGTPGLNEAALARLRGIAGVTVAPITPLRVNHRKFDDDPEINDMRAVAVDPATVGSTLKPVVAEGSTADFGDDTMMVDENVRLPLGVTVAVWFPDGSRAELKVVALLRNSETYISSKHASGVLPTRAYLTTPPGTSTEAVNAAVAGLGARAVPADDYFVVADPFQSPSLRFGVILGLGIIAAYAAMSIVNTSILGHADRRGATTALRLTGATSKQVVRVAAYEAVIVAAVGIVAAVVISAVSLFGLRLAVSQEVGPMPVILPWWALIGVVLGCVVVTVASAVLPTRLALRSPPATADPQG